MGASSCLTRGTASESIQSHRDGLRCRCPEGHQCPIQKTGSRPGNLHSNKFTCMTEIPVSRVRDAPLRHTVLRMAANT